MPTTRLIKIAGGFSLFFFLFHIPFYWFFNWKENLACLNPNDWAIMMCFNVISIVLLFLMAYVSLAHTKELLSTSLGRSFLLFSSWFYCFRIVAEFIFFDEPHLITSVIIILLCGVPAITYGLPLLYAKSIKEKV